MRQWKKIIGRTVKTLSLLLAVPLIGCKNSDAQTVNDTGEEGIMAEVSSFTQGKIAENEGTMNIVDQVESVKPDEENSQLTGEEESENEAAVQPPEGWELVLASEDWGLSFKEQGAQPVGNATASDLAWYDAYYVGDDSEKVIYLTFDCGYENGNTAPILDALKKHNVKAMFFVVGHFLESAPDMAKRMVEEGHMVGNHTYHHLDMPTISDKATFQKEMDDVANLFNEITGTKLSPYYRPPQGKCNTQNLKMAKELGYSTIFWSLAYVDWNTDNQPSHEEAFSKLTERIHPGAIVLLHNTSKTNGEILDELLTKWEDMGYRFELLPELKANGKKTN